jgi:hypothetical protein
VSTNKTYYYRVKAYNEAGSSSYSNMDSIFVPKPAKTPKVKTIPTYSILIDYLMSTY